MGGLNSKQIADIKKGKTDTLVITNQRKENLQKKLYTLTNTKTWNLSNNFLSNVSSKISALTLTTLDLSSNDFLTFPAEICKISTLTNLDLSYNFITDIPADVNHLAAVTELNLSFNRITDIQEIGKITTLRVLKASNNYISKIPDSFSKLIYINLVSLSNNNISTLPKTTWPSLETFHIASNLISQVPFPFLCQANLRVINLSRNKIQSFPPPNPIPGLISNLREIHINNNHLAELNTNIYSFPKLELLDLKSNELSEIPFELFVHSPLIHTLELSFNPGCRWGMHMPNTFAPPPLIRDIHLSIRQCSEIGRNFIGGTVNSDSENTDSESSSTRRGRRISPTSHSRLSLNSNSHSPTPSPTSSPSASPNSSPSISRRIPFSPEPLVSTTTSTTTIATSTTRMTTTVITADAADTQISAPKSRGRPLGRLGPDETDAFKRKASSKYVKKYVHNKKQFRLIEHDHSIWDQAVTSHATHLAELAVWSGDPNSNIEEEIKKLLLHMTQIRPGLFLSSKYAAQDRDTLRANNITHILVVGAELHPAYPSEFEYYTISVRDNAIIDDLSIYFPACQKFIDTGRKKGGVLVHCAAGSSRSASCVMAYLMWKEHVSFNDARKELRTLRPIVKTNFYLQLEFYEGVLRGQTKRKPKHTEPDLVAKPKVVRSTSLPTIDAFHAFQIETSLENRLEAETPRMDASGTPAHLTPQPLRLDGPPRTPVRAETVAALPHSASQPIVLNLAPRQTPKLQRASRSLYTDLRVGLPRSESQSAIATETISEEKRKEQEGGEEGAQVKEDEEVGAGVPSTVIRQASDFEDLSEIHTLMRVHSLPEIVADGKQLTMMDRKLSRGKSFLKNSKINLLETEEP